MNDTTGQNEDGHSHHNMIINKQIDEELKQGQAVKSEKDSTESVQSPAEASNSHKLTDEVTRNIQDDLQMVKNTLEKIFNG